LRSVAIAAPHKGIEARRAFRLKAVVVQFAEYLAVLNRTAMRALRRPSANARKTVFREGCTAKGKNALCKEKIANENNQ
jgi:hypothetical protein